MNPASFAIRACGLSKTFRIYARPVDRMLEAIAQSPKHREFEALRPLDVEIAAGETVGIVGRNGSGKSTLLQLIAGTLQPSEGSVDVRGRVAALLELGSGFNPDFSGRENVFLNAQVLGMRRRDVEERFPAIERFADIGAFIDQPVRTYSSGMLVRLAFAVAIHAEPDVLIIDEALAVGDEAFQRKCFGRIESLKEGGTTILFVSHSAASVLQLCDRAILLDAGERLLTGIPKTVVAQYQRLLHAPEEEREAIRSEIRALDAAMERWVDGSGDPSPEPTSQAGGAPTMEVALIRPWPGEASERLDSNLVALSAVDYAVNGARILDPCILSPEGKPVNVLLPGRPYRLCYRVAFDRDARQVEFNMSLKTVEGVTFYGASSHGFSGFLPDVAAGSTVEVEFAFDTRLLPGTYFFNVGCQGLADGEPRREFLHRRIDAGIFRIEAGTSDRYKVGFLDLAVEPAARWRVLDARDGID